MSLMKLLPVDVAHVAEVRHVREALRQHRARELVDLREGERFPTEARPRDRSGLYAAEK